MKYRKKPVVIEAVLWTGGRECFGGTIRPFCDKAIWHYNHDTLAIETTEGIMTVQPGDWIIRGVKGEYYPCKPDIFDATYEKVEDAP